MMVKYHGHFITRAPRQHFGRVTFLLTLFWLAVALLQFSIFLA